MTEQEQALARKIRELEQKNSYLQQQIKNHRYGLTWIDVPEAFEPQSINKIPILREVKEKSFTDNSDKPTHILIESENYHALQCLNYTHNGKVDVIYIDPPYNTGNDGFIYKDKRILQEYPDGTPIPKDHPLRHSCWLSFMQKRLELAKNLLSEDGVIFISIDDNELYNLKLLCDSIFDNAINTIVVKSSETSGVKMSHVDKKLPKIKEYVLMYSLKPIEILPVKVSKSDNLEKFSQYTKYYSKIITNKDDKPEKWNIISLKEYFKQQHLTLDDDEIIQFKIDNADKVVYRTNNKSLSSLQFSTPVAKVISPQGLEYYWWEGKQMLFLSDNIEENLCDLWTDISTINLNKEICDLKSFENGQKPLELIKRLLSLKSKQSIILDFFAGSGTTMHAVCQLNEQDGGHRQCILVQRNEGEARICEEVTYERNRRVMQGYTNANGEHIPGLGGSLKYYKTDFVGTQDANSNRNSIFRPSDDDRIELAKNAGTLVSLAENTLYEIVANDFYQIFTDKNGKYSAVYLQEDYDKYDEFVAEIQKLEGTVVVYTFSWGSTPDNDTAFIGMHNVSVKPYPNAILDTYKNALQKIENNK